MNSRQLFSRTIQYLNPKMASFVLLSVLSAVGFLAVFSSVGVLLKLILNLVQSNSFSGQEMKRVILYLALIVIASPFIGLTIYGIRRIERKTADQIRDDMMHSILNADEKDVEKYSLQELHNRMMSDVEAVSEWICGYCMAMEILEPFFSGMFSIVYLCFIDARIALLCLACASFELLLAQLFCRKRRDLEAKVTEGKSDVLSEMKQGIDGCTEIHVYSLGTILKRQFESKLSEIDHDQTKRNLYLYGRNALINIFVDCVMIVLILLLGSWLSQNGYIEFSDIMMAIPLSDQICQMMVSVGNLRVIQEEQTVHEKRVFEIIDLPQAAEATDNTSSDIVFDHVKFAYGQEEVLHDLSFTIHAGERIGIVGETGSGKSTIMKMILGLYLPSEGTIQKPVSSQYSYMPQNITLFSTSIASNIAMSDQYDQKDVQAAAQQADCLDFIEKEKNGFDYIPREDLSDFSGGQLQRIGLARCLYSSRPVILMDEPTGSLDSESSHMIEEFIHKLGRDKTVIVISHRLDFAEDFDRILVLRNGRLEESGIHAELLKQNGYYAQLWNKQNSLKTEDALQTLLKTDSSNAESAATSL